jgi:hypothetical protein
MVAPTPRTPNYKLLLTEPDRRGWQDQYYENMRIIDSGLAAVTSISNFMGVWANNTAYELGMRVTDPSTSIIYECATPHTSSASPVTFTEERLAHPTYWGTYSFGVRFRGAWTPDTLYSVGDYIAHGHVYAICSTAHVSGAVFDTGPWEELIDATATVEACEAQVVLAQEQVALAAAQVALAEAQVALAQAAAAAAEASAISVGARLIGTSTTSLTLGLGPITLTTQTAEGWAPGLYVTIARGDAPVQFMSGVVTAYDPGTGVLNVTVDFVSTDAGTTHANWTIGIGGRGGGGGGGGSVVSSTALVTTVPATLVSSQILADNPNRTGAAIYNDSAAELLVNLGAAASSSAFTVDMLPGAYYELPFGYTGALHGIWAAATGNARVTEFEV